eukprot:10300746-Alexandrium_andersonii.AAC.1
MGLRSSGGVCLCVCVCGMFRGDSESAHESGPRGGPKPRNRNSASSKSAIRQSAIRAILCFW